MNTNYVVGFTIILIIFISYGDKIEAFIVRSSVCSDDGRCYKVVNKFQEPKKASEILAKLNKFCIKLLRSLRDKYIFSNAEELGISQESFTRRYNVVKYLLNNYNPDNIIENAPKSDVNTSYVEDKGKVFAICLREKSSGENKFHNMEELEFVVLHEMGHLANKSMGHETDYWTVFKFLMQEAELAGLHVPVNYERYPMNYCSLEVDYSPYFDNTLPPL